jgi:hypothetical protein
VFLDLCGIERRQLRKPERQRQHRHDRQLARAKRRHRDVQRELHVVGIGDRARWPTRRTIGYAGDGNAANNTATDTDTIVPRADLSISASDGVGSPQCRRQYDVCDRRDEPGDGRGQRRVGQRLVPGQPVGVHLDLFGPRPAAPARAPVAAATLRRRRTRSAGSSGTLSFSATCTLSSTATGSLANTASTSYVNDAIAANNSADRYRHDRAARRSVA